jgi:hypothetical protein
MCRTRVQVNQLHITGACQGYGREWDWEDVEGVDNVNLFFFEGVIREIIPR